MTPDETLKLRLAEMLPEVIVRFGNRVHWKPLQQGEESRIVRDTELDYLVRLAEAKLDRGDKRQVAQLLVAECGEFGAIFATWQQRVLALCKTKGIEA